MSQQDDKATFDKIRQKLNLIQAEIDQCKRILRGEKIE